MEEVQGHVDYGRFSIRLNGTVNQKANIKTFEIYIFYQLCPENLKMFASLLSTTILGQYMVQNFDY